MTCATVTRTGDAAAFHRAINHFILKRRPCGAVAVPGADRLA
jgi:hypothetical protein